MNWYKNNKSEWKEIIDTVSLELKRNPLMVEKDTIQELINQVIKGTDFKKRKFKDFTKDKFTINAETKIWDKIRGKYYYCTTSWFVEKDFFIKVY